MKTSLKILLALDIIVALSVGIVSCFYASNEGEEIFFFGKQGLYITGNSIALIVFGSLLFLFSVFGTLTILKNSIIFMRIFSCGICWTTVGFVVLLCVVSIERMAGEMQVSIGKSPAEKIYTKSWFSAPFDVANYADSILCSKQCACNWAMANSSRNSSVNYSVNGAKKVQECPNYEANDEDEKWSQIEEKYNCEGVYDWSGHFLFTDVNKRVLGTCYYLFDDRLTNYFAVMILLLEVISIVLFLNCSLICGIHCKFPRIRDEQGNNPNYVAIGH